ncbi:MAG TPA: phosphotransferase, partial [Anaerolineales bacterium]|nr:phosphotransferase [Anaerolineales bacterium]
MAAVVDSLGEPHFVRMLTYLPGVPFALFRPHSTLLLGNLGKTLGYMSRALQGFDHPASRRNLRWDFDRSEWTLTHFGKFVTQQKKLGVLHCFLDLWRKDVKPFLGSLRKSVVYHDANEYNILVARETPFGDPQVRLIDFGDMLYTYTLAEVAIGGAYSMLEKPDPLSATAEVVRGFHEIFPLTEEEIMLLFCFMAMRLCMSVCICAYQQQEEPENQYLKISEIPAWQTLEKLKDIHPRFAAYTLREACNLEPHPDAGKVRLWLKEQSSGLEPVSDYDLCGGYGEARFHDPKTFRTLGNEGYEWRSIHLGLDYFVSPGTTVISP